MITDKGKELITRFLAGHSGVWAGALEFGVGNTAPTVSDESLEFPFIRVPVDYVDYDPSTYTVTIRAILPENVTGELHEVGVFSSEDFPSQEQGHQLLLDYSGEDTVYSPVNAAVTTDEVRVGVIGYRLTAPAAGTATLRAFLPRIDLNAYTGNDVLNLAYHYSSTGGSPSVNVRFESTLSDYFLWSFTPTAGYNIETSARNALSQVGAPSWDTVNAVYVELDDAGELILDGLMIEDTINIATYGMIARQIMSPELIKASGVETEAIYELTLGF